MIMHNLEKRRLATQSTLDEFKGKLFDLGKRDCAKMVNWHLNEMDLAIKIAKAGDYSTPIGAKRALRRLGAESLPLLLDQRFPRHQSPAFSLMGDIIEMPSDEDDALGIGALAIYLGNNLIFHYHESALDAVTSRLMVPAVAAWKVLP